PPRRCDPGGAAAHQARENGGRDGDPCAQRPGAHRGERRHGGLGGGGLGAAVREHLAPLLVGEDAWMRPALMKRLKMALYGNTGAHSAVEMALLDLTGRAAGVPV